MIINIVTKEKSIQDVVVGDVVLSYNIPSDTNQWQPVTALHEPIVPHEEQVHMKFDNGGSIVTSTKHPMLSLSRDGKWEYHKSGDIAVGDTCKQEIGDTNVIHATTGHDSDTQFFDITVEENNNFFAGDKFESMVVVHNSATTFFPLWHLEAEDLVVLKNNKGTEETRVRHMDYCVQFNGFLYQRLLSNKNITLFSPDEVPDLYEAFFADQDKFAELYVKYERSRSVRKRSVSAVELITNVMMERNNTRRIYIQNVDHTNTHGAFNPDTSPVRMSNLCVEIVAPTAPLTRKSRIPYIPKFYKDIETTMSCKAFRDEYGEISLCTLGSLNWGAIHSPADFERPAELAVRALDELLDYQDYPMIAAGVPAKNRRNLGIGVCNLAYVLAKRGLKYSDGSANALINEYAEAMSYYLIKASVTLAKEKGACAWFNETKYSKGILPIDTYKKHVDSLVGDTLQMDWDGLRKLITEHGMRHSTLMALMPVESSSQLINATNGIEPARSAVAIKGSKDGILKQVVPEIHKLKNKYEYVFDMPNTTGYLEIVSIFQKYADQSISANTSYSPLNYADNKIPMSVLIHDLIYAYKLGVKTLYYQNTDDGAGEVEFEDESDCASCKL